MEQVGAVCFDGNLNSIAAARTCPRDREPIQIERNALGINLDAVGLGHTEVGGKVVGAGLIDDELVVGVGAIHRPGRRILQINPRFYLLQGFKDRGRCPWRGKRTLGKRGRRKQVGGKRNRQEQKDVCFHFQVQDLSVSVGNIRPGVGGEDGTGSAAAVHRWRRRQAGGRNYVRDRAVEVAGHDVVVGHVAAGAIADDEIAAGVHIDPARGAEDIVAFDAIVGVQNVNSGCAGATVILAHDAVTGDVDVVSAIGGGGAVFDGGARCDIESHSGRRSGRDGGGVIAGSATADRRLVAGADAGGSCRAASIVEGGSAVGQGRAGLGVDAKIGEVTVGGTVAEGRTLGGGNGGEAGIFAGNTVSE